MEIIRFLIMVTIGGFIGYITNKVAIKMLFRPVNPIKIGPFVFQGVFPKRKDEMAISLADTIESELLSKDAIMDALIGGIDVEKMKTNIKNTLVTKISEVIPPMAKMFLGDNIEGMIRGFIDSEGDKIFEDLLEKIKEKSLDNLNIRELVKTRIDELDFIEFEQIIFGLMNRELRHIEVIGLVLGSVIGVIQYLITLIQL